MPTQRRDGVICGAKTRGDGHPCLQPPAPGSNRCRLHGGASPCGSARGNWKGSVKRVDRLSKLLPERLGDKVVQAESDPQLLELRADIALLDVRLEELLAQINGAESGALWDRVHRAFTRYCVERTDDAFDELEAAIEAGSTDQERWREVRELLDERRRLVESERKRLVEMKQMLTAEAAMNLFATLAAAVRRHVHDEDTLRAIDAEFRVLVNLPGRDDAHD